MNEKKRQRSTFAEWLIGFRAHTNQTQGELGHALGVHRQTVNRWESNELYPKWEKRLRLNEWAREVGFRPVPPKQYGGKQP